jgi:hypothetical protein
MLDITTLAAWGEFIGGIAVVVSLIYLVTVRADRGARHHDIREDAAPLYWYRPSEH